MKIKKIMENVIKWKKKISFGISPCFSTNTLIVLYFIVPTKKEKPFLFNSSYYPVDWTLNSYTFTMSLFLFIHPMTIFLAKKYIYKKITMKRKKKRSKMWKTTFPFLLCLLSNPFSFWNEIWYLILLSIMMGTIYRKLT